MNRNQLFAAIALGLLYTLSACGDGSPEGESSPNGVARDDLRGGDVPGPFELDQLAPPNGAQSDGDGLSGTLTFREEKMIAAFDDVGVGLRSGRTWYPGFSVDLVTSESDLLPLQPGIISNWQRGRSFWDVVVGVGKVWRRAEDAGWSRASLPINLVSRIDGQLRNCVAFFMYKSDEVTHSYVQCSQETTPDDPSGDARVLVEAAFEPDTFSQRKAAIAEYRRRVAERVPTHDWSVIDQDGRLRKLFNRDARPQHLQSLAAVIVDDELYQQAPQTRRGPYPYPADMRHGVYSVSKSVLGALSLLYLAQRYGDDIFAELIVDHVPALAEHKGWQGVTFEHAINMVTGTLADDEEHFTALILADSADGRMELIAGLADAEPAPGEHFNYASTNTFTLSYAMQQYVEEREGSGRTYWELVEEDVLEPIGVRHLPVQLTKENDGSTGIPILAHGAYPTADDVAKIALLFAHDGEHLGQQLLHRERTRDALNKTDWPGYKATLGRRYKNAFWIEPHTLGCSFEVPTMLGHGANYVAFPPSGIILIRFMDHEAYDLRPMLQAAELIRSACVRDGGS